MQLAQSDLESSSDRILRREDLHSRKGRRRLLVLAMVSILFLGGGFAFSLRTKSLEPVDAVRREVAEDLNLSLVCQQLDQVFQLLLLHFNSGEALTSEDRFLLQSWLQYDERFVDQNRNKNSLQYERTSAHLRLGKGLLLLGKPLPASTHFQSAIALLESLVRENPVLVSFRLELADSYQQLAICLEQGGRLPEAIVALNAAIQTLRDPSLPASEEQQMRLELFYKHRESMHSSDGLIQ